MFDELDRKVFEAGHLIFKDGDEGDCAYLIEEGYVEIYINRNGEEQLVSAMGKGEMFGEIALIDHKPRTATVRSTEKTTVVPIPRNLVEKLMEKSDPILRHLLLLSLERFRNSQSGVVPPARGPEGTPEQKARGNIVKGTAIRNLSLAHGITRALARDEFHLYYQPICKLPEGTIAGFEALIRWHHPTDGIIPPLDFLELAEQTGQIHQLGIWTLERACRDWPELRQYVQSDTPFVSVNLSPSQLNNVELADGLKTILKQYKMPAAELKLELLETVIVEHPETALEIINKIVELGCSFALDDFGTGYSGLDHLRSYPIQTLKVDRAFIAPILKSTQSQEIVRSSIDLAHSLNINVVAEGIENEAVAQKLSELKCDYGQGWHFGRPAPLPDLAVRYASKQAV